MRSEKIREEVREDQGGGQRWSEEIRGVQSGSKWRSKEVREGQRGDPMRSEKIGKLVLLLLDTHKGHRVVAPSAHNAEALHHCVLHQGLGVRPQGLDGDVLLGEVGDGRELG